jgi:hypothetical protein
MLGLAQLHIPALDPNSIVDFVDWLEINQIPAHYISLNRIFLFLSPVTHLLHLLNIQMLVVLYPSIHHTV